MSGNGGNAWSINTGDQLWYTLDSSGQVWAWEFSGWQAKDGIQTPPVKVSSLSNIVAIVGRGEDDSCNVYNSGYALDSSGHVWAWGDGTYDEIGNDGTVNEKQLAPVRIPDIPNIVEIAGNNGKCYALDSSGNLWGFNSTGNGITKDSSIPVEVKGLPK